MPKVYLRVLQCACKTQKGDIQTPKTGDRRRLCMKKLSCKVMTCALVAAMVLPFAACNKKNGQEREKSTAGTKISAESPWFEDKMVILKPDLKLKKEAEYVQHSVAGVDENYIIVYSNGNYKMPTGDNVDWQNIDYRDYSINAITVVDKNTEKILSTVDLVPEFPKNGYVDRVTYKDGKICASLMAFNETDYSEKRIDMFFDPATGKLTDKKEFASSQEGENRYDRTFETCGYTIGTRNVWEDGNKSSMKLFISKGDEPIEVVLKSNDVDYYDIPLVFKIADNKVIAAVVTTTDPAFYEVDLQTGKATEAPAGNYGWINVNNVYSTMTGPDDVVYFTSGTGVYKIDVKNKQNIEVFNYSWCSTNRNYLTNAQMVECSDDRIVFCGEKYERVPMGMPSQSEPFVLTLDRAATNPHAGKTIIELYSSGGYVEDNISEAIVKYNNTSSTHYIEVRDRYSNVNSGIDYSKITSDDEMQTADLNFNAKMSNELAMDILNGEGPDILLNCSNYGQLNNTNYLADLSKYVGTLDSDKYFTNIVDAAKIDGKLYQFPVCYMVSGIFTDAKYAGKSGVGFTTAEYEKFLNDTLNGKDVINYGQAQYFTRLFTAMSEKFISDGKVDFSGPEFAELAEFVKNNVPEKAKSWNELYSSDDGVSTAYAVGVTAFKGDSTVQTQAATYTSLYGYSGYFYQMGSLQGATGFFGIPSTDGRGPMLEPYVSVAVSAQSKSIDACGEFIKMLMSDDVQKTLAASDNLVLSRKAFREAAKDTVDYFNNEGGRMFFGYDRATGKPVENRIKFSDKNVDDFEKIILSISRMNSADAAINLILIEEMPAYFSGQKDLAAVIKIAQDRAQKVISERG